MDDIFVNIDNLDKKGRKELTIEKIYQKKTQLEHILLRPDTYIGSVERTDEIVCFQIWISSLIIVKNFIT